MTAKKKNVRNTIAKAGGRPTKYRKSFIKMAEVACKEGGFTDAKLAKLFDTNRTSIHEWKNKYPKFRKAIIKAKDEHDTLNVEGDLLKSTRGFYYNEITKERIMVKDIDGKPILDDKGAPQFKLCTTKIVRKLVPPSVTGQIYWTKNRNRERWPDKHDVNLSDADGEKLNINVSFMKPEKK